MAMAVASAEPIRMGRLRGPSTSVSIRIGCWLGISTRTPTMRISIISVCLSPSQSKRYTPWRRARGAAPYRAMPVASSLSTEIAP